MSKFIDRKRGALKSQGKKDRRRAKHSLDRALAQHLPSHLNTKRTRRVIVDGLGKRRGLMIRLQKEIDSVMHCSMDGGLTWAPMEQQEGGAA